MEGATGARVAQIIRENAKLISSIPLHAATTLTDEITKAQQRGARPETIAKLMRQRFPQLLRSRVQLISRTETSKASAALTRARAEELNLPCYIWRTSKDVRVRDSHRLMDGVVCFWNDPPAPEHLAGLVSSLGSYNVGDAPNDRCTASVVLTMDDITFPVKVHHHGTINYMTKQQFKAIATSLEQRAA
jgi:SPP1 gp7 family putative phage head morphogenesis protein